LVSAELDQAEVDRKTAAKRYSDAKSSGFNPSDEIKKQMRQEDARLLYVAMTRARQKLVIAGKLLEPKEGEGEDKTPKPVAFDGFSFILNSVKLHGCLNEDAPMVELAGFSSEPRTMSALYVRLEPETIGQEKADKASGESRLYEVELYSGAEAFKQGAFEGRFSVGSTSYSNLTKYGATVTVEMLEGGASGTDESHAPVKGGKADEVEFLIPQELQGAEFGNALHKLMESLPDFKAKDFEALLDRHLGYHVSKVKDLKRQNEVRQRLLASLPIWLHTKLGRHDSALGAPFALESIPKAKCLAEVRFSFAATIDAKARDDIDAAFDAEFSKAGVPDSSKQVLANLRLGTASKPLPGEKTSGLAEKKHRLSYAIDGLLNGSIDLFFQEQNSGRYFILDWKTNRLGASLADYGDDSMAAAILEAKYHLQFAIYSMVADEYMRARLGSRWDYRAHFGGAYYLFLRAFGIDPKRHPDLGVFYHLPSPEFLERLRLAVGRPAISNVK
jgi:ATP-dependent exoDNAse (exonuclease V) beta subunit